ncbi:PREDICTED: uncharacterized protein LOC105457398 isoform X1 [Wasmannia auropunctata]|uniref:uncharacterized protein LOC105457398 isoform X1 n=1 Tax=Wasmannia auropunctata TaxID=64793 RepID=UPI0005EE4DED|nr:PREDICTED: uncharacterized protein LOC105457398 isoform X1 [Wasmannia auropunctata]XP_011700340.1 PREDICTED: uncharacterized protein LOC105457398 isoform X1 [Wasmannia auropunctata]
MKTVRKRFYFAKTATTLRTLCLVHVCSTKFFVYVYVDMHVRHKFTNPYAERRNSRLTVTLICSRFLAKKWGKRELKNKTESTKVSKHGSWNAKGESVNPYSPPRLDQSTLNIFHRLQLLVQTFWGGVVAKPPPFIEYVKILLIFEKKKKICKVVQTLR